MKKAMVFIMIIMIMSFTGCGMYKEHEETKSVEAENSFVERVEVEEIEASDEYLEELEFNSQHNVYFGER